MQSSQEARDADCLYIAFRENIAVYNGCCYRHHRRSLPTPEDRIQLHAQPLKMPASRAGPLGRRINQTPAGAELVFERCRDWRWPPAAIRCKSLIMPLVSGLPIGSFSMEKLVMLRASTANTLKWCFSTPLQGGEDRSPIRDNTGRCHPEVSAEYRLRV